MLRSIIIEIPDTENYDWDGAVALWKSYAGVADNSGYNSDPRYSWYKIDPFTRLPVDDHPKAKGNVLKHPMGTQAKPVVEFVFVTPTAEIAELRSEIDALTRALYKTKHDMQKLQKAPSSTKVAAMQSNLNRIYSRWSALPVKAGC